MKSLLLLLCFAMAEAEVFTAMADMEALLFTEKEVVSVIDQYIGIEMKRLEKLKEFAREYQNKNLAVARDGLKYIGNPVNAYVMIKRLASDWSHVESLMRNNMAEVYLQNITNQRGQAGVKFPDSEDLQGAAMALLRLQDTYQLSTTDIADGRIQGVKRAEELSAHDCFELGRVAYNQADYYHTLMWMEEALTRRIKEQPPTITEAEVLEYLAYSMYQQGNLKRALVLTKRLAELDPNHPRAAGNIKFYEDTLAAETGKDASEAVKEASEAVKEAKDDTELPPVKNPRKDDSGIPERDMYEALCRGESFKTEKEQLSLYCHYKRDTPFLRLAPIKVEIVHWKPKIVFFRNILSDEEIEVIKELASPKLARATVQNSETGENEPATYRISKSAWLKGEEHPVIAIINKRVDDMTNLNMLTAEDLQIANYGIGGHYDPHYDFARKEEKNAFKGLGTGNRIATVLFYMSTPDAGGATVFPELKVGVFPRKNDAVFWFNLLKNGEGDMTTRHAACPVLAGVKWVSNKWIHEIGQEFRRPCALREDEYE